MFSHRTDKKKTHINLYRLDIKQEIHILKIICKCEKLWYIAESVCCNIWQVRLRRAGQWDNKTKTPLRITGHYKDFTLICIL